jgi:hypothetical protein
MEKQFDRTGIAIAGISAFLFVVLLWPPFGEWAVTSLWKMFLHHAPEGWTKSLVLDNGQIFWALFTGFGCAMGVFQEQDEFLKYRPSTQLHSGERWKIALGGAKGKALIAGKYATLIILGINVIGLYLEQTGQSSYPYRLNVFIGSMVVLTLITLGVGIVAFFYYASMALPLTPIMHCRLADMA